MLTHLCISEINILSILPTAMWYKDIIQLYLRVFDYIRLQGSVVFDDI